MSQYYVLDGHEVKPATLMEWGRWFEGSQRQVDRTQVGDVDVSTMFLGLDHSVFGGPPLIFETMIFGGAHDQWQERCSTWDEAVEMHRQAVEMVKT